MFDNNHEAFTQFTHSLWNFLHHTPLPYAQHINKHTANNPPNIPIFESDEGIDDDLRDIKIVFEAQDYNIYVPLNQKDLVGITFCFSQNIDVELYPWFTFDDYGDDEYFCSIDIVSKINFTRKALCCDSDLSQLFDVLMNFYISESCINIENVEINMIISGEYDSQYIGISTIQVKMKSLLYKDILANSTQDAFIKSSQTWATSFYTHQKNFFKFVAEKISWDYKNLSNDDLFISEPYYIKITK